MASLVECVEEQELLLGGMHMTRTMIPTICWKLLPVLNVMLGLVDVQALRAYAWLPMEDKYGATRHLPRIRKKLQI
jgi:hypothetical protein